MSFEIPFANVLLSDLVAFFSGALSTAMIWRSIRKDKTTASTLDGSCAVLVANTPDTLLRVDPADICTFASTSVERLFGRTPVEAVGRSLTDFAGEDAASVVATAARARSGTAGLESIFRAAHPSRGQVWVEARFGSQDQSGSLTIALRDVSTRKTAELALRVANLELNKLAGSDPLTDLANRRRFDQSLESECRRAVRSDKPLTLLLLDVDRFKAYNDRYGHPAGDECLKQIGLALKGIATRSSDVAARFGGEEFALLLPGLDERDGPALAERVREAVAALRLPHEGNLDGDGYVSVSVGCATMRPVAGSRRHGDQLVGGADRALYAAKRMGRNRVVSVVPQSVEAVSGAGLAADGGRLACIEALRAAGALQPTPNLHRIAQMAAVLLGMPVAFLTLLDRDTVSVIGHHGAGDRPLPVPHATGMHLLGVRGAVVVPEANKDPRFASFAAEHGFAFLAAAPLLIGDDLQHVGALWVLDRQARGMLDEPKRVLLSRLAALAVEDLDSRVARPRAMAQVA